MLVLGLQGRPWNDLGEEEKAALRKTFDALVAEVRSSGKSAHREIDRMLDAIGVVDPDKPGTKKGRE